MISVGFLSSYVWRMATFKFNDSKTRPDFDNIKRIYITYIHIYFPTISVA